ncbi:MAG: recombination protein RecR [Bacteroidales bacterium]|nr:recombination protein RecR [Bacteroidales bacterium]MBP5412927.1 recombination protein RecR [Bacteroidales bacterium]
MQEYSSKILENAINQISKLPGVGKKTAVRLALYLLRLSSEEVHVFTESIETLKNKVFFCKECFNIADTEICDICANIQRDKSQICVVQDVRDVIAIENTAAYKGVYHVLGGVISPMDGIGVNDLNIQALFNRLEANDIKELIFALPATTEGDTTAYYISKHLKIRYPELALTSIARGVSVGNDLENIDEITLARSIVHRVEFETAF